MNSENDADDNGDDDNNGDVMVMVIFNDRYGDAFIVPYTLAAVTVRLYRCLACV